MTDEPQSPHNGTRTSKAAAVAADKGSQTWRRAIYDFVADRGEKGATDDEMQDHFDTPSHGAQRPRRQELEKLGLVKKSGYLRRTRAGQAAEVWVIVDPPPHDVRPEDQPPKGMSKREQAYLKGYSEGYLAGLAAGTGPKD